MSGVVYFDYIPIMVERYCRLTGAFSDGAVPQEIVRSGALVNTWTGRPAALRDYYADEARMWRREAEEARENGDTDAERVYRDRSMAHCWLRDEVVRIFRTGWGS